MKTRFEMSRRALSLVLLFSSGLHAETVVLKNGQSVVGRAFVRQGEALFISAGPNGEPVTTTTGIPLAEIAKVECEQPSVLKNAPEMLTTGKQKAVLDSLQSALKSAEPFGTLPGSFWPDLFVLQAHVLFAMGKDDEAARQALPMEKTKLPDLVRNAQALRSLIVARSGDDGAATSLLNGVGTEPMTPATAAASAVSRGLVSLEKKQFEQGLKFFLELPVFLPNETALSAIARLGSARAYHGMEDYDRAIAALEDLIKTAPGTPEVLTAQSLLPEWQRRRAAVEDAKKP